MGHRWTEAVCQGCHQCGWGGVWPCPSQSYAMHRRMIREAKRARLESSEKRRVAQENA